MGKLKEEDYGKCPVCGERPRDALVSGAMFARCASGHGWHRCPEHGVPCIGGAGSAFGERCTCKETAAVRLGVALCGADPPPQTTTEKKVSALEEALRVLLRSET